MKRIWRGLVWLGRRWYLLLVVVGAVVGWIVHRELHPSERIAGEKEAIDEQERYELLAADHDADMANAHANFEYRDTIRKLGEREAKLVEDLLHDPGRRVRLLNKLSRKGG